MLAGSDRDPPASGPDFQHGRVAVHGERPRNSRLTVVAAAAAAAAGCRRRQLAAALDTRSGEGYATSLRPLIHDFR